MAISLSLKLPSIRFMLSLQVQVRKNVCDNNVLNEHNRTFDTRCFLSNQAQIVFLVFDEAQRLEVNIRVDSTNIPSRNLFKILGFGVGNQSTTMGFEAIISWWHAFVNDNTNHISPHFKHTINNNIMMDAAAAKYMWHAFLQCLLCFFQMACIDRMYMKYQRISFVSVSVLILEQCWVSMHVWFIQCWHECNSDACYVGHGSMLSWFLLQLKSMVFHILWSFFTVQVGTILVCRKQDHFERSSKSHHGKRK